MAEAAEPCLDLEIERDNLREESLFVLSALKKKLEFDFTDSIRPLLTDTTPATPATIARLSIRLRSLQERLKKLEEQTETPSPPAQTAASRTAASYTATAIEPSFGRFRMYSTAGWRRGAGGGRAGTTSASSTVPSGRQASKGWGGWW